MLEDNYEPEADREGVRLPDRKKMSAAVHGTNGHWAAAALKAMLSPDGAEESSIASAQRNARTGSDIAPGSKLPVIPEPVREMFCDCNPPVPILLAIYQQGDAIEACFDDERQVDARTNARTVAVDSVRRDRFGKHGTSISLFEGGVLMRS